MGYQHQKGGLADFSSLIGNFNILFMFLVGISVICFSALYILSIIDIIRIVLTGISVRKNQVTNKNLTNYDSKYFDIVKRYYFLTHPSATHGSDQNQEISEPYNIMLSNSIVGKIYLLSAAFGLILTFQIIMTFILSTVYTNAKFPSPAELFEEFKEILPIIVIITIGSVIISEGLYKKQFKKAKTDMSDVYDKISDIKSYIYDNLTTDIDFLNAMRSGDVCTQILILKNSLNSTTEQSCVSPTPLASSCNSPTYTATNQHCDVEAQKMMFTVNLYTYFSNYISTDNPQYDKFQALFTSANISQGQNSPIDPSDLFLYNRANTVINNYSLYSNLFRSGTCTGIDYNPTSSSSGPSASPSSISSISSLTSLISDATQSNLYYGKDKNNKTCAYTTLDNSTAISGLTPASTSDTSSSNKSPLDKLSSCSSSNSNSNQNKVIFSNATREANFVNNIADTIAELNDKLNVYFKIKKSTQNLLIYSINECLISFVFILLILAFKFRNQLSQLFSKFLSKI